MPLIFNAVSKNFSADFLNFLFRNKAIDVKQGICEALNDTVCASDLLNGVQKWLLVLLKLK